MFPDLRNDIKVTNADANEYLRKLCKHHDWSRWRAVLFLDPFGTQVEWATIDAVAQTQAIDLWCLFPLGVAVNRLLPRNGLIDAATGRRLDLVFGSRDWYSAFYKKVTLRRLSGEYTEIVKVARFNQIGEYFVNRLRSLFAGVARRPLPLYNRSIPLYWLCFAAGDKEGASLRVKVAEDILASPRDWWRLLGRRL